MFALYRFSFVFLLIIPGPFAAASTTEGDGDHAARSTDEDHAAPSTDEDHAAPSTDGAAASTDGGAAADEDLHAPVAPTPDLVGDRHVPVAASTTDGDEDHAASTTDGDQDHAARSTEDHAAPSTEGAAPSTDGGAAPSTEGGAASTEGAAASMDEDLHAPVAPAPTPDLVGNHPPEDPHELLQSSDPKQRFSGVIELSVQNFQNTGCASTHVVPVLLDQLCLDPSKSVRWMAASVLGHEAAHDFTVLRTLVGRLGNEPDDGIRWAIVKCLYAQTLDNRTAFGVIRFVPHSVEHDVFVISALVEHLMAKSENATGEERTISGTQDSPHRRRETCRPRERSWWVRKAILHSLGKLVGDPSHYQQVGDGSVREEASMLPTSLRVKVVEALVAQVHQMKDNGPYAHQEDPKVQSEAIRALRAIVASRREDWASGVPEERRDFVFDALVEHLKFGASASSREGISDALFRLAPGGTAELKQAFLVRVFADSMRSFQTWHIPEETVRKETEELLRDRCRRRGELHKAVMTKKTLPLWLRIALQRTQRRDGSYSPLDLGARVFSHFDYGTMSWTYPGTTPGTQFGPAVSDNCGGSGLLSARCPPRQQGSKSQHEDETRSNET